MLQLLGRLSYASFPLHGMTRLDLLGTVVLLVFHWQKLWMLPGTRCFFGVALFEVRSKLSWYQTVEGQHSRLLIGQRESSLEWQRASRFVSNIPNSAVIFQQSFILLPSVFSETRFASFLWKPATHWESGTSSLIISSIVPPWFLCLCRIQWKILPTLTLSAVDKKSRKVPGSKSKPSRAVPYHEVEIRL